MINWQEVKLGDICEITSSKRIFMADYVTSGIPFYRSKEIIEKQRGNNISTELFITEEKYEEIKQKFSVPQEGDILLTSVGTLGIPYVVRKNERFYFKDGNLTWIKKSNSLLPEYLYYFLVSSEGKIKLENISIGTTQKAITIVGLKTLEITLPPIEIQKKISSLLKTIDDKIELNNKINNNLEQQFKLLYNYYFCIDSSELWNTVPFSKIISFQEGPGIRNWQYVTEKGIKFINIRCINNGDLDTSTANMISIDEANNKYKHFLLDKGDIVMSCSGTLGRYAIVREEHLPLCLNTSVIRFKPVEQIEDFSYIYGYLTSPEFLNKQREMACGSVQSNFGPTHLKKIFIKEPPIQLRREFHKIAYPIIKMLLTNRTENTNLSTLRDTLLPKLMKGEIDVSKVNISADKLSFTDK